MSDKVEQLNNVKWLQPHSHNKKYLNTFVVFFNLEWEITDRRTRTITALSHTLSQDLVVRLLFTLGNLTAKIDEARLQLFQCEGCMGTLLRLYDSYQRRDDSPRPTLQKGCAPPSKPPAPAVSVKEDEDVLVKLVRVLANMCIHPAVGPALATDTTCIQLLMETLGEHSARMPLSVYQTPSSSEKIPHLQLQNFLMWKSGVLISFENSCLLYCTYRKFLPGTKPLALCREQDVIVVENILLICLFLPSLVFLSVLSVQYTAHPLLVVLFSFICIRPKRFTAWARCSLTSYSWLALHVWNSPMWLDGFRTG